MYKRTEYDCGSVIQVEKSFPGNYGAPGETRRPKRQRTPEDMERRNQINRTKKLQRIILANFKPGDYHLVLNYRKDERPDAETAKKQRRKFFEGVRRIFEAHGLPFKWIAITEHGKQNQALHHHLLVEAIENPFDIVREVKKLWKYGNAFFSSLYEEGDFEQLASYFLKLEEKHGISGKTYSRSRNLIVPKPKVKIIKARIWKTDPAAPKGWYVVKESIWNGWNPITGMPVQHYSMRRLD